MNRPYPAFTKKERELHAAQSLDKYKERVLAEATRRLKESGITQVCVNRLGEITSQDHFEEHVSAIYLESYDRAVP